MAAQPDFELYQERDGDRIEFTVEYELLDQYGATLRGTDSRYTGRSNTDLSATLSYQLYHALAPFGDGTLHSHGSNPRRFEGPRASLSTGGA